MKPTGSTALTRKKKSDAEVLLPYDACMTLEQEAFHVVKFLHLVMDSSQDAKQEFLKKVLQ
jgi:hypothetical protein